MKKNIRSTVGYINGIILLVLLTNVGVYYVANMDKQLSEIQFNLIYILLLMFIEALVIMVIIKKSYETPILQLELEIKKFLVGKTDEKKDGFKKPQTGNPHLDFIISFFGKTINTLKNIKEDFLHGKAIKGEVELATELQEKLLNKKIENIPSIDLIGKSKPAGEIGGDSFDVIKQENNYYIYVGDATGHGVGAGFVMVMVNALISGFSKVFKSGANIVAYTNEILKPRVKSNILMSLLMVRWNEEEKRLFMTGAGHEYLMVYKHKQKKCFKVKSGGIALGMTKNIHKLVKEQEISIEENDIVVLYSDGITEAINRPSKDGTEQMFSEDRLIKTIEEAPAPENNGVRIKTARSVFNNISIELSKFMGYKYRQFDDITLVVAHYKGQQIIENDVDEEISKEFITEWSWDSVNKIHTQ